MIKITKTAAICNLGNSPKAILENVLEGKLMDFTINLSLPTVREKEFNLKCNRMLLYCVEQIRQEINILLEKYDRKKIAVVIATANSGIDKFEETNNPIYLKMSNPAEFLKAYLRLEGAALGVSTACSSGIKVFSTAQRLLNFGICDAVIAGGVDTISKFPLAGFKALEVLSETRSNPFSKNRCGMNISEAAALFILEKEGEGIDIMGIGETSDAYHTVTPDPKGTEAAHAIQIALNDAGLLPSDVDYINLHGTGTLSNDLMEANAVYNIFQDTVPASSTKPLTGHCLGAAASIETAICCTLLTSSEHILPPHIFDGEYDNTLPKIRLAGKNTGNARIKYVMCNAFGFGGTNAVIILGK